MILEFILLFIATVILAVILYGRWNYGILESLGVPVVKPSLFLGSIPNLHKTVIHEQDIAFFKKYGPVYGVYEGRSPFLYVCDAELVKRIMVADFDHFKDRRRIDLGDEYFNEMMDFLEYEKWKVVRAHIMPAFSPAKYKRLKSSLDSCLDDYLANLSKICGDSKRAKINLRKETITFLVDYNAISLYGTKMPDPESEDNFLRQAVREMMGEDEVFNFFYPLALSFPFLTKLAPSLSSKPMDQWKALIQHVMAERKKSSMPSNGDFLDNMVTMLSKVGSEEFKALDIKEVTVYSQGIVFFAGAYDTFNSAIIFLAHYLGKHPDYEKRLLDEVDEYFKKHDNVEFETGGDLPFLKACLLETLRLTPAFRMSERMCVKDFEYNGFKVKKGVNVVVPLWAYHRNPDNFNDPEEFKPERFLPENAETINPYANAIFGHGPRNCAGQRFALDFLKIVTARLFRDFRFELRPDTQIQFKPGRLFMVQYHPVYYDAIKRR